MRNREVSLKRHDLEHEHDCLDEQGAFVVNSLFSIDNEEEVVEHSSGALFFSGSLNSMNHRILVIDDDPAILDIVELELSQENFEVIRASSAAEGMQRISDSRPEALILDLYLPDRPGQEILEYCVRARPDLPVIVLTGTGGVEEATSCMSMGAADFVEKPFERARLITSLKNALQSGKLKKQLQRVTDQLHRGAGFDAILGESSELRTTKALLKKAVASDVTVLVTGESGTGKEVAARALHAESSRSRHPFVAVNCGAIPENLIESELFGHEAGAFTGATQDREGRFEQADGGTIFLDEIGELRTDLQVRLLRVLQERTVDRVGGRMPIPVDVRVIAATNCDLSQAIAEGTFREDLFYRISVFPVELPPLRKRGDDLKILVEHFLRQFTVRHQRELRGVDSAAWRALSSYDWPGNIRELMNVIERGVILEEGALLTLNSLTDNIVCFAQEDVLERADEPAASPFVLDAEESQGSQGKIPVFLEETPRVDDEGEILPFDLEEARIIQRALRICDWNVRAAAERLGLGRATVYRKVEKYGLGKGGGPV